MKLFETTERWTGKFSISKNSDDELGDIFCHGEITYTPEDGVNLSYSIIKKIRPFGENKTVPDANVFYGILDSGKLCTLIGVILPYTSPRKWINGLEIQQVKINFLYMFIGDSFFIDEDEIFTSTSFTISNMQEFFFAEINKDFIKHAKEPLVDISTDYGQVQILSQPMLKSILPPNTEITSLVYCQDSNISGELEHCFKTIKEKYEDAIFELKKDINYIFHIKFTPNKTIDFIGQCIYDFVDMFSILMYTTTYPEFISVSVEEKGKFILYPSMAISKEAIEQWKNENLSYNDTSIKSYPLSPYPDETNQYCKNCIDIKAVITKWLEKRHDFSIIAQEIQSRTKYSNLYKAYGKIVLYAAQLEAIAKLELELSEEEKEPCTQKCTIKQEVEECKKSKQKKRNTLINNIKYAYTINKYANIKIKDQLCLLLPPPDHDSSKKYVERKRQIKEQLELLPPDHDSLGIEKHLDLGTQVSGLRSDIIHSASKPRDELKVLNTLKIIEIGRISGYIEMIVLGYVLSKLEIDCHIISKYQDRFTYP